MEFGEKIKPISNKRTLKLHEATELQNLADEKWLYCFSKQVSEVKKKKRNASGKAFGKRKSSACFVDSCIIPSPPLGKVSST